eukprot:maker-scaffold69_size418775-snap-gene-3.22 protein:Tk03260 transcript:maker-scaffold69_size418775-snap-gene-3.22-mRNA-1 annotation:"hypothetical protein HELRODRAFT_95099"
MTHLNSTECWHCSLKSYQVSYLSAEEMHHFVGYILPGVIFAILGLKWAIQLAWEWTQQVLANEFQIMGLPVPPQSRRKSGSCCLVAFSLPWEGIVKLILTGLGIMVSVIAAAPQQQDSEYVTNIRYATIYLFFALSGLVDILVYYCGYSILPEGIQSMILSLSFIIEGLLYTMRLRFEGYLEQQIHCLLIVAIFACSLTCILEVLYDNRLVKFSRAYLCILQGTWLIHGGCIMQGSGSSPAQTYPDSLEWVSILYSWHVAGNFILFIGSLLLAKQLALSESFDWFGCLAPANILSTTSTPRSNSFNSPATVQTNASPPPMGQKSGQNAQPSFHFLPSSKQLPLPPAPPPELPPAKHRYNYPHQFQPVDEMSRASSATQKELESYQPGGLEFSEHFQTRDGAHHHVGRPPMIVEALPRDNVVMSEDYRTLSREEELRASFKGKESSLI